jgi:phosphocarrier protein
MSESVTTKARIRNELGLHARAAAQLVELATRFEADLFLSKDGREVNGKSIMGVLLLAATRGSEIGIRGEGPDAAELVSAVVELITGKFGEDK